MIKYQKIFSEDDCLANPKSLYVFGDNTLGYGLGGQAIIRDCHNAIGVVTKFAPANKSDDFLSGTFSEREDVARSIAAVFQVYCRGNYDRLVLPEDGLGTGRARLKEKAPAILAMINKVFYNDSSD